MNKAFNASDNNDDPNYAYSTADENGGCSNDRNSSVYIELDKVAATNSGLLNVC